VRAKIILIIYQIYQVGYSYSLARVAGNDILY
jgi:hypothetical protein